MKICIFSCVLWDNIDDLVPNRDSLVKWSQFSSLTHCLTYWAFFLVLVSCCWTFLSLWPQDVLYLACTFLYFSNVSIKVQNISVSQLAKPCVQGRCSFFEKASELLYCLHMAGGEPFLCNYAFFVLRKTAMYPPSLSEGYCHVSSVPQRWSLKWKPGRKEHLTAEAGFVRG